MLLSVSDKCSRPLRLMGFIGLGRQQSGDVDMRAVIISQGLTHHLMIAIKNIAHVVTRVELQNQVFGPYGVSLRQ